ncbi:hypothetical protein BH24BAC1_BH24BAC1_25110 [soil metagenome]
MFRWAPYPFIRITLFFIGGILLYVYQGGEVWAMAVFAAMAGGVFLLFWLLNNRLPSSTFQNLAGLAGLLCFLGLGYLLTHVNTDFTNPRHLLHQPGTVTYYTGRVSDYLIEKPQTHITTLEVHEALIGGEWKPVTGKVRLTLTRDSAGGQLRYGDRLLIRGSPAPTRGPANPFQFDYRRYLAWRNIHHQHYVTPAQVRRLNAEPEPSLLAASMAARRKMDAVLRDHMAGKREYGIASALLLGVKDDLDNSIRNAYANTGTMHVLAVSGLHVGILYGFLNLFLLRFRQVRGYAFFSAAILILVLVGYAFLTGLSPSVLRAVCMFSLFAVGRTIGAQRSVFNTLALVAFGLLCYNPYYLLEVGFQLSFLAVSAIVYLQPKLYGLVSFPNRVLDYFWALTTLSLAAQLATFPLGLLYFHQFPVYFLLSNLVVVPLAGMVLWAGLVFLLFSWAPGLSAVLAFLFETLVSAMNWIILTIEWLPRSVISGVTISTGQTWLLYGTILALILFLRFRKLLFFGLTCALVAIFSGLQIQENRRQAEQKALAVYSVRGKSVFAFIEGREAALVTGKEGGLESAEMQFHLLPHLWHSGVNRYQVWGTDRVEGEPPFFLPPVFEPKEGLRLFVWRGLRVLEVRVPLPPAPSARPVAVDLLLIQNNARVDPAVLQAGYRFRHLILDSSNFGFPFRRLKEQLTAAGLPFHSVPDQGALVLPVP